MKRNGKGEQHGGEAILTTGRVVATQRLFLATKHSNHPSRPGGHLSFSWRFYNWAHNTHFRSELN